MLTATNICLSQVVVNLQLPAAGITLKSQLWNLSVINNGFEMKVQMEMTMTDASTNQRVLTAQSRVFTLPQGARQIRPSDIMPVMYTPGNAGYVVTPDPDGFLPVGVFHVCYALNQLDNDRIEQLSEDCETIEVEPVSPPQLTMPAHNEFTESDRPIFGWIPPAPINMFSNLMYDWVLVAVQPMQSTTDAVQQNIPVFTQQNISYVSMQYPLSAPALDTGVQYAWRVTAKSGQTPIAVSEIWTFRIKKPEALPAIKEKEGPYSRLRPVQDASYVVSSGIVWIEFLNEVAGNTGEIHVYDISDPQRKELQLDSNSVVLRYGQNFLKLDFRKNNGFVNGHMYLLTLQNAAGTKGYLKFEYRNALRSNTVEIQE